MLRFYWIVIMAPAFVIGLAVAVVHAGVVGGYMCGREYLRGVFK